MASEWEKQDATAAYYHPNQRTRLINWFWAGANPFEDTSDLSLFHRIKGLVLAVVVVLPLWIITGLVQRIKHSRRKQ